MTQAPHIPVLIGAILDKVAPVQGRWLDGTFGAGGYTRALLDAGADHVTAVDRDPAVFDMAAPWADQFAGRLDLVEGTFGQMDDYAQNLDGVVLDLGVSSMQLDQAERGFSFMKDGPLDMRMAQSGPSAADLVNETEESVLADILYLYGEERASRAIARAIHRARPITRTGELVKLIEGVLPRPKPGQAHPATRSFQALRIAVNDEYGQLYQGLLAAERALRPGGLLAVVTFHSIEDRMVKRFFKLRAGVAGRANRYAPATPETQAQFELLSRKAIAADPQECAQNPRARSAKLRVARRLDAPSTAIDPAQLGMPILEARK